MKNKFDEWINYMIESGKKVTDPEVCKIMALIGKIFNPVSILEPNAGMGELLYYCDFGKEIDAYSINEEYIAAGKDIDNRINFFSKSFLNVEVSKKYDLIISQVPFTYGMNPITKKEEYRDLEYLNRIFSLLNRNGVLVALLPGKFLYEDYSKSIRQEILDNYSLEMIVELPYDKFRVDNHDVNIVVIKNTKQVDNVLIKKYDGDIQNIVWEYLSQKGEDFVEVSLLDKRWDRYYHDKKFNWLNLYTPSRYKTIGELSEVYHGLWGVKGIESGEVIILDISNEHSNIRNERIISTPYDKYLQDDKIEGNRKYILQDDDLLVNMKMNDSTNIVYYDESMPKTLVSRGYIIIRPVNEYFKEFVSTIAGRNFLEDHFIRLLKGPEKNLGTVDIEKVKIPLYDSRDLRLIEKVNTNTVEEQELVSRLSEIQDQLRNIRKEKDKKEREIVEDKFKSLEEYILKIRDYEGMEKLLIGLIDEVKYIKETVNKIQKTGEETNQIVKDIYTMVKNLHGIQDEILYKLNQATNEEEKECIYAELSNRIMKLVEEKYENPKIDSIHKIESEYQERFADNGWIKLDKDTRRFLLTARVIYDDLKVHMDIIDFSPICIALTKALERELSINIFNKMQEYFKKDKNRKLEYLPDGIIYKNRSNKYVYKYPQNFTLGSIPYVLATKFERRNKTDDYVQNKKRESVREFLKDCLFKKECFNNSSELEEYIVSFSKEIEEITSKYRNRAAHKDSVNKNDADRCYQLLITTEKILVEFTDKLR